MTNPDDQATPVRLNEYDTRLGLTKREYFAAMVMQGILSDGCYSVLDPSRDEEFTNLATRIANSLIQSLNKENT